MALIYELNSAGTDYVVSGCTGTAASLIIPPEHNGKPVIGIKAEAFNNNKNLNSIFISDSVRSIGNKAFYNCINLNIVTLGKNIYSIEDQAFYNCSALTNIFIPGSVRSMGNKVFSKDNELAASTLNIYCEAAEKPNGWDAGWHNYRLLWNITWNYKGLKLDHTIDVDSEWIQEGCHWNLKRFFDIKLKNASSLNAYSLNSHYCLGETLENYLEYTPITLNKKQENKWRKSLYINDLPLDTLLEKRTEEGWLDLTVFTFAKDTNEVVYSSIKTFGYYLELPPNPVLENTKLDLVIDNPGELVCSWDKAVILGGSKANASVDEVNGYCIELKYKPAGKSTFETVSNLAWNESDKAKGKYSLIKTNSTAVASEDNTITFVNSKPNTEVYIENASATQFYFEPKKLGINAGDSYKFTIYPFSYYEGSFISGQGTDTVTGGVSKGIVRVRTDNGWVEGQVWVKTKDGWTQADSVYTKTEDGWTEAI